MACEPRILVVVPTRNMPAREAFCAINLAAAGLPTAFESGAPRDFNRNRIAQLALDKGDRFTHYLWFDDDTLPPRDAVARLLEVDQPVVVGLQPLWVAGGLYANVKLADGPRGPRSWPDWVRWQRPAAPFRIGYCGFGCVLMRREVLATIGYPWFVEDYGDVYGQDNQTEDTWFCQRATACGFEIWCQPACVCGHLKLLDMNAWLPRSQVNLSVTVPSTLEDGDDVDARGCPEAAPRG